MTIRAMSSLGVDETAKGSTSVRILEMIAAAVDERALRTTLMSRSS
jgi:hypothetical protein